MTKVLTIHPTHPQPRYIAEVVNCIRQGGIIAYPTDSAYALGCHVGDKEAIEKIRALRQLQKHHNFTLVCRDLSDISKYAKIDNVIFRMLKHHTPGPYTFILPATRDLPKRLLQPKRKSIGIRVPDHVITKAILAELNEPLMSVTLLMPEDDFPLVDIEDLKQRLKGKVSMIVYDEQCSVEPTTVVDLTQQPPEVLREGRMPFRG